MPGKEVKRWDVYEAVRKTGASKEKSARIANSAPAKKQSKPKGKK